MDEMEIDGETEEANPLALGTGSGGVKGRRRGQKFNCEICGKVSLDRIEMVCAGNR
jgi:hypothetical protein